MHLPDPEFPPLLTGHAVKAPEQAFEAAVSGASRGRFGAGDVVWARDVDRLDMAVVLEPTVPPDRAIEMLPAALLAVGDSLGALVPPEVAVTFGWPNLVRVNGAQAGQLRVAMSSSRVFDDVPSWMVVGIALVLRRRAKSGDPGLDPDVTDLQEEGCGEITRTELVESISRHFLSWVHTWETEGFRSLHDGLQQRLDGVGDEIEIAFASRRYIGRFVGIDEHGDMVMETPSGTILLRALEIAERSEEVLP